MFMQMATYTPQLSPHTSVMIAYEGPPSEQQSRLPAQVSQSPSPRFHAWLRPHNDVG